MTFSIKYKPLFKVDVLHNYFLNKGLEELNTMSDSEKEKQLASYEISSFLNIVSSSKTQQKLSGHNLVFKTTNAGFTMWSKVNESDETIPFISLDVNLYFTFLLKLKDSAFYNYTNLKLENAGKLHYFSNRKPAAEPGSFPFINISGDNSSVDENFVLSEVSANAELGELTTSEKDNLFGLIRIFVKGDNISMDLTDSQHKIQDPFRTFEILFNNRKTIWRYIFNSDQKVKNNDDVKKEDESAQQLISKTEQPLTQQGFISIKLDGNELPNPNAWLIKPDTLNKKYYSEIYM